MPYTTGSPISVLTKQSCTMSSRSGKANRDTEWKVGSSPARGPWCENCDDDKEGHL